MADANAPKKRSFRKFQCVPRPALPPARFFLRAARVSAPPSLAFLPRSSMVAPRLSGWRARVGSVREEAAAQTRAAASQCESPRLHLAVPRRSGFRSCSAAGAGPVRGLQARAPGGSITSGGIVHGGEQNSQPGSAALHLRLCSFECGASLAQVRAQCWSTQHVSWSGRAEA